MRKLLVLLAAAVALSGCVSTLENIVDDRAEEECHEENRRAPEHLEC